MTLYCAWLQLLLPLLTTGNLLSPIIVTPALYGSDMTLDCNFLPASMLNDQFLVVTWQHSQEGRGDMVVHSYYYEKDQLDLQDKVYRNRTQLFPEKFPQGNASLRLMDLRLEDGGLYTCTVNTQIGSTTSRIQLVIAAPYRDPHLTLALLDQQQSSITLKVVTGGGYPEAKVWWTNQTGSDIIVPNNTTQMPDSQGLYNIISQLTVPMGQRTQCTFVLAHSVLNKNFTLPVTLMAELPHVDEPSRSHIWAFVSMVAVLMLAVTVMAVYTIFSCQDFEHNSVGTQTEDTAV